MNTMQSGYDINDLFNEAQSRWLKPAEVLFILQNHEKYKLTQEPPKKPTSGSLFLYNKRVLRFFRRDGHNWRKKKDGRTVGEAHERLKVGNVETLNCYYAHGEDNPSFQRRSYWMLDPACEHIVLVHYRDIAEGNSISGCGSAAQFSPGSISSVSQSPSPSNNQNAGCISVSDYQSLTSPGSIEVSSDTVIKINGRERCDSVDGRGGIGTTKVDVDQALRKLEEQLSLNEDCFKELESPNLVEDPTDPDSLEYKMQMFNQNDFLDFSGTENFVRDQCYPEHARIPGDSGGDPHNLFYGHGCTYGRKESLSWKAVLDSCNISSGVRSEKNHLSLNGNEQSESTRHGSTEVQENHQWQHSNGSSVDNASLLLSQEIGNLKMSPCPSEIHGTNSDYYAMLFDQGQIGPLESDMSLTLSQKQKFTIQEISPEWGYTTEATKIIIVGSFLCDSSESAWTCMFGDVEVPVQIIQEGVLRCEAPPHIPGKVTLCITAGNRESCSEVREFDYRLKASSCFQGNSLSTESTRSPEELLLLVRFVQLLLSDSSMQKRDTRELEIPRKLKADEDSWASLIGSLLIGSGTLSGTIDWILEELLKDKLQQWISCRQEQYGQTGCSLSKKEQGIIHMVAGLGFEWALKPILSCGVSINFRDINGWTALHWAARFGREKMVAALIASDASAGAVTDPSSQDLTGKTAASIAATSGHKGLAGYLAEVALTSHLSSLTLEETELSKGSAEVDAETTVNSISKQAINVNEDQLSLKRTLAAVRNAAQAAARIQSAFRAHSFRKRQQKNVVSSIDEYGMSSDDIQELSAMSKLNFRNFRNPRDHDLAALSIQKKYRGWKGRKDFLAFRQKIVKIQAHVRGYQVRKNYKVICWAVGVLEKVVLRWRRRGVGLRGFRPETDSIDESEDEDILKVFRKQKVDASIKQAISRVLSMVKSPEAREQYHRVLERYYQAKDELGSTSSEASVSNNLTDISKIGLEDVDMYPFP